MIYTTNYKNLSKFQAEHPQFRVYSIVLFPKKGQKFENISEFSPPLKTFNDFRAGRIEQDEFVENYIDKLNKLDITKPLKKIITRFKEVCNHA